MIYHQTYKINPSGEWLRLVLMLNKLEDKIGKAKSK